MRKKVSASNIFDKTKKNQEKMLSKVWSEDFGPATPLRNSLE